MTGPARPPRPPMAGQTAGPRRTRPRGRTTPPPAAPDRPAADPAPAAPAGAIVLAAVVGAHGIGGEVRLKLFTEDAAVLRDLRTFNGGALTLFALREGPNGAIARFAEVADRTAAEGLRGTTLHVPRSALPPLAEGEYYHADLIGLPAFVAGEEAGRCVTVENFGAGDIVEIERADGRRFMVPVAAAVTFEPGRLLIDAAFVV